jgi:polysaccharide pyruvyl transferase WcaK-like protein
MGSLEIRTGIRKRADMSILKCKGSLQFKGKDPLNVNKIALLTPYTGGNLGDAAIQEAVIANIQRRYPDADIYLITLCPKVTTKLHGVPSLPIGITIYEPPNPLIENRHNNDANTYAMAKQRLLSRGMTTVKQSSLLHSALKHVYQIVTPAVIRRGLWLIRQEMFHVISTCRFLKGVSLLIVSGGGQLDDYWGGVWGHPYALFKWGLIARAVGTRYVFLSVGTSSLESRLSTFFIRQALKLATYRSYRDQTSKRLLKHISFTLDDAVYPDLAFSYVNRGLLHNPDCSNIGKVIGVSPIAYLSRYGWPRKDLSVYERYFESLVSSVSTLIRQGYSIVLFSTEPADRKVINDVVDSLAKDGSLNLNGRICHPHTDTLDDLFAQLVNVDYVVASRLHGVLLSHLLCIPVLAISYDRKVDTYMADMGLSKYCLDIHSLDTVSLLERFESLTTNADRITSCLEAKAVDYACALERQYDFVLGM